MVRLLLLLCMYSISYIACAQNITIEVNKDTISLEEQFQVKYTIDAACDASDLKFKNFLVVGGPSVSRSVSIINGKRSAESSYTILLTAIEEGTFALPSEICEIKMSKPVEIVVIKDYESREAKEARIRKTKKIKKI